MTWSHLHKDIPSQTPAALSLTWLHASPLIFTVSSSANTRVWASCGFISFIYFFMKSPSACFVTSYQIKLFIPLHLIKACDYEPKCGHWSDQGVDCCPACAWTEQGPLVMHHPCFFSFRSWLYLAVTSTCGSLIHWLQLMRGNKTKRAS